MLENLGKITAQTFKTFWVFEAHFLIKIFLIKKCIYFYNYYFLIIM